MEYELPRALTLPHAMDKNTFLTVVLQFIDIHWLDYHKTLINLNRKKYITL